MISIPVTFQELLFFKLWYRGTTILAKFVVVIMLPFIFQLKQLGVEVPIF